MGFFGGKNKDAGKKAGASAPATAQVPPATRRSVRRVVPSSAAKTTSRSAKPGTQAVRPATAPVSRAAADDLGVEDIQLPPEALVADGDGLDLGSSSAPASDPSPASDPTPTRPPSTRPILASAAPAFSGGLSDLAGRNGPSRTGDQDLIQFLIGKAGLLDEDKAVSVRVRAEKDGIAVDAAAVLLGMFTEEQLVNALSQETWVPHLKVDKYEIRKKALDTITREDAVHFGVFPVDKLGSLLTLAMVNPLDAETLRTLEQKTGLDIKKVVATRGEINQAIDRYYGGKVAASEGSRSFTQEVSDTPRTSTQMLSEAAPEVEAVPPPPSFDEPAPALAMPSSIHPDFSADIQDIDDLLEAEDAIAPAIIEPVSIKPEESSDALELNDAAIAPGSNDEFALVDAPQAEASALDQPVLEQANYDTKKTEEVQLPAAPVPGVRRHGSEPRSATAKFTAGGGVAGKAVNLVPVLEDEFRYAISHGKGKVFERWVALQTRNRIVNAVSVEKDLDHLLAGLYEAPRKAG